MRLQKNYLAFDIGGTYLKYALINSAGTIIERNKIPTPKQGLEYFKLEIELIIQKYQEQIKGIAFSCPGKIDQNNKTIHFGGSLPFLDGVQLTKALKIREDVPISIENDGKSAALAEMWIGQLKDVSEGAAIVLGTGIGGGIIINGKLIQGSHFQAGELSFMLNDNASGNEKLFGYNSSAVCMIQSISRELQLKNIDDGPAVFEAIKAGNPVAGKIFNDYCRNIAVLIFNIQSVIDLKRFVICGGISEQTLVVDQINSQYNQILDEIPLAKQTLTRPEICNSAFHNDANLYGALYRLLLDIDNKNKLGSEQNEN
ncbi:ROK family protein [Niallia circulans]|uniref:ROK family protein n=1 Tax=Niallia circulans TaxID=1397 RepID=UPI00352337F6